MVNQIRHWWGTTLNPMKWPPRQTPTQVFRGNAAVDNCLLVAAAARLKTQVIYKWINIHVT